MAARFVFLLSLFTAIAAPTFAQTLTASPLSSGSNPQAITLATKSLLAMTGGIPVKDAKLIASVTRIAGSDNETGTAIFYAKSSGQSRIELNVNNDAQSEVRTGAAQGFSTGQWRRGNGKVMPSAQHNTWTDSAWFFPALSSLTQTSNPNYVFSYAGREQREGLAVEHLRISQILPTDTKNIFRVAQMSAMDFYLDPASFLPLAIAFNVHPDNDMNTSIPVEIRFADYQIVDGVRIPFHLQRLLNGGLALDIAVTHAVINSGLSDTQFTLQ